MSIILWLIFGALAGWIASLIMGTNRSQGLLLDIVMGILGALIGGFLSANLLGRGVSNNPFDIVSLVIAVIGAIILTMIVRAVAGRRV
ncbi:MAG TPA: GlsB/YeaQ/YmgE family stress response membrane protein [Chthoniobacterales bacterium]